MCVCVQTHKTIFSWSSVKQLFSFSNFHLFPFWKITNFRKREKQIPTTHLFSYRNATHTHTYTLTRTTEYKKIAGDLGTHESDQRKIARSSPTLRRRLKCSVPALASSDRTACEEFGDGDGKLRLFGAVSLSRLFLACPVAYVCVAWVSEREW